MNSQYVPTKTGVALSKQAIALFAKQKRLSTANKEKHEENKQKKFEKNMIRRKVMIGSMPRTVFDFKIDEIE